MGGFGYGGGGTVFRQVVIPSVEVEYFNIKSHNLCMALRTSRCKNNPWRGYVD